MKSPLLRFSTHVFLMTLAGSVLAAPPDDQSSEDPPPVQVRVLRQDPVGKSSDRIDMVASVIEVTLQPLAASPPHRHPGTVSGYVAEGEFDFQIGDEPLQKLRAGDTFFEPTMILHRVSRNPSSTRRARVIVVMIHPASAKQLVLPPELPDAPNQPETENPQ